MKWIKIINKSLKSRLTDIMSIVCLTISYAYLIDISNVLSLALFNDENFKFKNIQENYKSFFYMILISPLSITNYFYNNSKHSNIEISKIRFIIIILSGAILFGSFLLWLEYLKILNLNLSLEKKICLIIYLALIIQPYIILFFNLSLEKKITSAIWLALTQSFLSKSKNPLILYLLAHFYWILALFFVLSSLLYLENENNIFSQINLIILIVLIFIATTYSAVQQFFYKIIKKLIIEKV